MCINLPALKMIHEPLKAAWVEPAAGNCCGVFVCFLVVFLSMEHMALLSCFELSGSKNIYSAAWGETVDLHGTLRMTEEPYCFLGHLSVLRCTLAFSFFLRGSGNWTQSPAHVGNSVPLFITPWLWTNLGPCWSLRACRIWVLYSFLLLLLLMYEIWVVLNVCFKYGPHFLHCPTN